MRTLPVSMAGVIAAAAMADAAGYEVPWLWFGICLTFAVLAQIASNFANEYFDYRAGIDGQERRGPQRGVANGVIAPRAMLAATLATLGLACLIGLSTIWRGGWLMLPCGVVIALGALAYSAGPWPLSRHCMGEVAVVIFYGIAPVCLTYYLLTLEWSLSAVGCGLAVGFWGAMVILVNNYRDIDSDRAAEKRTLSTRLGQQGSAMLYLALGQLAAVSMFVSGGSAWGFLPLIPAALGFGVGIALNRGGLSGEQCTRILAVTAMSLLLTSLTFLLLHALG